VVRLAGLFPGSAHVRDVGLATAQDLAVWEFAKAGGFAIVWMRVGNQSTAQIEAIVRANAGEFETFDAGPVASMLVVTA
jgi:predicted nuclease of predicted toxin-antitoxin system